jgi:hypothetical protein
MIVNLASIVTVNAMAIQFRILMNATQMYWSQIRQIVAKKEPHV